MKIKICKHCGANIEGLIHHCDCCGALIHPTRSLFYCTVYGTGIELCGIPDKLDLIDGEPYADVLQRIDIDIWCFSPKKKTGAAYYPSRKQAIITVELDIESYVRGTKEEKHALLAREIQEKMNILRERIASRHIHMDDLFLQISKALGAEC